MKLLYLYVETWPVRCITSEDPIEVNFDCGYKFHYDSEANKLSCEFGNELPEGFFSVSSSQVCVDSVSVIIGDNGTGKTTIASVLGYLFQRGKHLPEYICIYKQAGRLVLYYHFESNRSAPDYSSIAGEWVDAEIDQRYADSKLHNSPFDIVYYSPYFSANEVWPGKVMADELEYATIHHYDISTGHLMQHPKDTRGNDDRILTYRSEDQKRILNFAHKYVNALVRNGRRDALYYKSAPILPPPIFAQLLVKTTALTKLELSDYYNTTKNNAKQEVWREVICNTLCTNPVWKLVSEIVARVFQSEIGGEVQDVDAFKETLIDICRETKKISDHSSDEKRFEDFAQYVSKIDVIRFGGEIIGMLKKVLKTITCLYGKSRKNGYILEGQVDISGKGDYDAIIDIRKHMSLLELLFGKIIGMQEPLMDVELANMSSGEMAYWTLFARIDNVFKLMNEKGDMRDILLFLDEAETTLHPEWQRQLVRNIIWFLEKYTNGRHVHVIFATHSPMILSDVPKGNVAFLFRDRKTPTGHLKSSRKSMAEAFAGLHNTFGANIYDLYGFGFFLQDSPMGEFAREKINSVLKKLAKDGTGRLLDEDDKQLVLLIGDNFIRKYMESCISSH